MAWSQTDTAILAGDKDNITLPTNFSAVDATRVLEYEQWVKCRDLAYDVMQSKVVGIAPGQTFTIALSGTATAGHPAADTVTITVTNGG